MSKQKQTIQNNKDAINSFDSKNLAKILSVENQILDTEKTIEKNQGLIAKQTRFLNKIIITFIYDNGWIFGISKSK
jgi:hypothetical protein